MGLDVIAYDSMHNRLDATKSSTIYLFEELIKNTILIKNSNSIIQNHHYTEQNIDLNESLTTNSKFYHNLSHVSLNQTTSYHTQSRAKSIISIQSGVTQSSPNSRILTYTIKITLEILKTQNASNFDFECTQLHVNLLNVKENEANYLW